MKLGEILVAAGKASSGQVATAVEQQQQGAAPGLRIGEVLIRDGAVNEIDVLEALASQYSLPVAESVPDEMLDPVLVADLPVEWARSNGVLPVRTPDGVRALISDPMRIDVLDDLALLLRQEARPLLTPATEIARAIERCYYQKDDTARDFLDALEADGDAAPVRAGGGEDLLRMVDQTPVTQLVNLILLEAVKARASDIHIEPFEDQMRVRYRVDGLLYEQSSPPKHLEAALVSRLKVMGKLDIAEKRLPQDGMAKVKLGEQEIDIRLSTIPVAEGERVVLRLLNRDSTLLPLGDLGMPDHVLTSFRTLLKQPNGIILVTGPTGSGKTTSLYAALGELDTFSQNILTIEDPIEYQLANIGQIQVMPKIGLTFAHGLRHILRQDPDVILVGEIRDVETAEIVLRASLTGHLVFSTLHTNDAASAVLRMVDMGIAPYLLASAIRASMAQRLVRTICPQCRIAITASDDTVAGLGPAGEDLVGHEVWEARGCEACLAGYRGRLGIYEIMSIDSGIREAIRSGSNVHDLARIAQETGMKSLAADGVDKIREGRTTVAELQRAIGHI